MLDEAVHGPKTTFLQHTSRSCLLLLLLVSKVALIQGFSPNRTLQNVSQHSSKSRNHHNSPQNRLRTTPTQQRMGQGVAVDDGFIINTNPATGEVVSKVKCSSQEEIDRAIQVANEAQKTWALESSSDRIALLKKGLKVVGHQSEKLVEWMILEMGKPVAEAEEEVQDTVQKDDFLAILEKSLEPQVFGSSTIVRDPFGVVTILSPWNYPVDEILLLALPALASGNTGTFI